MPETAFPSCFGEFGVEVDNAALSSSRHHNSVSCLYQATLGGQCRILTITWFKNLMGQGLEVSLDDDDNDKSGRFCCKIEMRPWLFWKKQGSKTFQASSFHSLEIFWDFSSANYPSGSPEPKDSFFVAILCQKQPILLLGDMVKAALRRSSAASAAADADASSSIQAPNLLSRRETLFGSKFFSTKAKFCEGGPLHEVMIECSNSIACTSYDGDGNANSYSSSSTSGSSSSNGSSSSKSRRSSKSSSGGSSSSGGGSKEPRLCIWIDRKVVVCVKRLAWKFRGNQTVVVDGRAVEVFWDVHNWLFSGNGQAVFMFQLCSEDNDKPWLKPQEVIGSKYVTGKACLRNQSFPSPHGFSLFLYAFRNE